MGFGSGFGSFMQGFQGGYSFMSRAKREQELMDEHKQEKADKEAASTSLADAQRARQGVKIAGPQPTDDAGAEVAGPPKAEIAVDLDKLQTSRMDALEKIGKAYGPTAAMQLNELYAREDERVLRKGAGEFMSAMRAGRVDDARAIYNRTGIGGVLDDLKGNAGNGFAARFRGQDGYQAFSMQQIEEMLSPKVLDFEGLATQAYRERQLALQERQAAATESHNKANEKLQIDKLQADKEHQQGMREIYRDNYAARNQNAADANVIRAQRGAATSAITDKYVHRGDFETTHPVTGAKQFDSDSWLAARRLHANFMERGYEPDEAFKMATDLMGQIRARSNGNPEEYKAGLIKATNAGRGVAPEQKPVPSAAAQPASEPATTRQPVVEAPPPQPTKGINPPAQDPLAGMGDEKARKVRAKLMAERDRYDGRPEAAARIKEIDTLIERIDRRDY